MMFKRKSYILKRKRKREKDIKKSKGIELNIEGKKTNFDLISYKLDKAHKLFIKYMRKEKNKKDWKLIKNIIDLVEINPKYNFEFLKNLKKVNQTDYKYDFNKLSPTLSEQDYLSLTQEEQKNPARVLFDLLNLYITNKKQFEKETKKIVINKYNIPLIEGTEKIRINYYIQLFSHFSLLMDEKQKYYISKKTKKINKAYKEKMKILKNKYDIIKEGIEFYEHLIPKMENFFQEIKLEENSFNIKIFTFILYITDIIQRIDQSGMQKKVISNFFAKEIEPMKELNRYNSLDNLIELNEEENIFPKNFGIKKKNNNQIYDKNIDKNTLYVIYNKFESIEFDGRNYVIKNLINDYIENAYLPLDILLLRNQSLSFFEKNNNNFLNVIDVVFNEFKEYFKFFIKSKCVQQALQNNKKYINVLKLIEDDNIINEFLSNKHLKSIPLFEFAGSGYTSKDILITCISGFPFKILRYNVPKNIKEYKKLKGIIFLFNAGMKMIAILHELISHLSFGYLNYVTGRKIKIESSEKGNKIENDNEGLYFVQLLFGYQFGNITLNDILVLLNGECLDSLKTFKDNLRKEFNSEKFKAKSKLLKMIFKEYDISIKDLENNKKIYSIIKSLENGMYIGRNVMNILLPGKAPIAYCYY